MVKKEKWIMQKEKLAELIGNFTDDLPVREIRSVDFNEKFAEFLIENGVIAQDGYPGDTVYMVHDMKSLKCKPYMSENMIAFVGATIANALGGLYPLPAEVFGKTCFWDRAEAEAELEKLLKEQEERKSNG